MNNLQRKFINQAMERLQDLDEWEQQFIKSLSSKPSSYILSLKQNITLNRIQQKLIY